VLDGFRGETIPFPLDFAPGIAHKGVEELRFAPGFFEPAQPGYWSYTFVWRTEDPAAMDAAAVGGELTAYFRGLIEAVDQATFWAEQAGPLEPLVRARLAIVQSMAAVGRQEDEVWIES